MAMIKVLINGRSVAQYRLSSKERESGRFDQEVCSMEICTFTSKGNKEGSMFCVQSPKCIPKIRPFNTLNNMKVSICTTYCSITYNALFPQTASTNFVGF